MVGAVWPYSWMNAYYLWPMNFGGFSGKEPTCQGRRHEMQVWCLGQEDLLEEGMATYSNILAWRIPWWEEPGGLQPIGLQRVRHDWSDWAWCIFKYKLLPQVFLSLYSHLIRGALGISNPHMNFGDIWERDPCSWSLEYKVKWIVIILLYMVEWAIDKIMRNMLDRQQRGNASLFLLNYTV